MHAPSLYTYKYDMKNVSRLFIFVLFFIFALHFVPQASASIVFPECGWDEITATCNCPHAFDVCADNSCSQCLTYKNDPSYRYLWKDIYCKKGSVLELAAKYKYSLIIPLLTTIVLELIVFAIKGYRKTRELISIALVNVGSFFVGILFLRMYASVYKTLPFQIPNIPFSLYGMDVPKLLSLLLAGAVVTAFEIVVLVRIAKFGDTRKVIVTAIIAHVISLILGLGTLNAVYPHFSQPRMF